MERECEITLLTYEQILGKKKLKIFNKIDASASITDFAILLGGEFDFLNFNDSNLTEKTGSYFTETAYCYGGQKNKVGIIQGNGKEIWCKIDDWTIGIRPVLTFQKNSFIPKKKNRNEILEIEYGFYPQTAVSKEMQGELEDNYQSKNVVETDRYYRVVSKSYNDNFKRVFENIEYKEYEYKGKRYVRVIAAPCYISVELSNGQEYRGKDIVWIEVEPIKWFIDKKSKLLLSKKIICAGIPFSTASTYTGDFESTKMFYFLNSSLIRCILQNNIQIKKEVKKEENKEKSEIEILLDEIEKYSDYSDDKNKLFDYVEQLISEYNKNVENLLNNESKLKIETVNGLKTKLIVKLENIIDNLKVSYDKRYIYEEITKLLENYNKILIGEEIDINDELISEFKKIYKSLTFIGNPKLVLEFIDLVDFEINKIKKYLENSYEGKNKIEYVDKKTFELYFRGKLHPLLVKLHSGAINKNVVNEISKMT